MLPPRRSRCNRLDLGESAHLDRAPGEVHPRGRTSRSWSPRICAPAAGREQERLHAFFDAVEPVFREIVGATREDVIVLVREFHQHACLSGGEELPSLESLTPALGHGID